MNRAYVSAVLAWWWSEIENEPSWAINILRQARASFGKPDSRYVSVTIDPKKLQRAVLHKVMCSFLYGLEFRKILTSEQLAPYRAIVQGVFAPAPPEKTPERRAEDPAVFLELMKTFTAQHLEKIIGPNSAFVKADKPLAAWRRISGEDYLIFAEKSWAKEYAKVARAAKVIECSLFKRENWLVDIQRDLGKSGVIKVAANGYRYRYDLYGDGTRDTTYVVAIPSKLLRN
ncbi:hypothetical protein SDC9_176244 [bioreactor metagenome]|uniref:Uncharacterized protein n=1 Tax=bioreactor metagenome TaxID=1076179 RepID=A0A645GSK7_9ZZZZ